MDQIEELYYTFNIGFLKALGIWPHDKSRFILLKRMLIIVTTMTYIAMQLCVFMTTKFSITLFIRILSIVCVSVIIILHYYFFIYTSKTIEYLHYLVQKDLEMMRTKLENEIIQKYAHIGRYCDFLICLYISFVIIAIIIIELFPIILDVILPLDEPRSRNLLFMVEYFVFRENYFYTKLLHQCVFLVICGSIIYATATQTLVFIFHLFGMFKIASHRVEHVIEDSILCMSNPEKERTICKRIMHAVIAHHEAMEFTNVIQSIFNAPLCVIIIVGIFSLSINLFGFVEATVSKDVDNIVICFLLTVGHLTYLFVANFIGQTISDYNGELFKVAYNISWYLTPVKSQKLILFLLQKASKDYYFTIGFIFAARLQNTTTVRSTNTQK
ncbi:uncharacterized protein [Linepithema humile]|uniref:uncharacterized protein isoform X2 n=1 Tax=Linepithema humile TaxID=83485 RepID=UPI00351E1941